MTEVLKTDVVIIGGGLAGLSCAYALLDSGLRVLVLESSAELGGRARSWTDTATGDAVDIGPHILLSEYRNMLTLLRRLGTERRIVWQTQKLLTLIDCGRIAMRMRPLPAPLPLLPSLLAAPPVTVRDVCSNARITWLAMRANESEILALDSIDARTFLRNMRVTERFIDWFWASAAMTLENVPLERCSAGTLLRLYRYLIGRNHYRIGLPACALADLFVPHLSKAIGEGVNAVHRRAEVKALLHRDSAVTGVILGNGTRIEAQYCVAAVPPDALQRLAPPAWVEHHETFRALREFQPSPYISTYIWFDRKLSQDLFWTRVWSPSNLNYDSYDLSNIREGWSGRASVIASNIIYSHRASDLSDDDIINATLRELADYTADFARARVLHFRVHRIPMAKLCPHPGIERIRPATQTSIRGLLLAGDWTRTALPMSMESAVRSGFLAADWIRRRRGAKDGWAIAPPPMQGLVRLTQRFAGAHVS